MKSTITQLGQFF